jgi:hypothetical protein
MLSSLSFLILTPALFIARLFTELFVYCAVCLLCCLCCTYCAYTEGHLDPNQTIRCAILAAFAAYNGLYYMEESVKNYQMHLTRTVLHEEHRAEMDKLKGDQGYWEGKEDATRQQPSCFDVPHLPEKVIPLSPTRPRSAPGSRSQKEKAL